MEIKQGDKVRVSKDAPKMYLRGFDHIFTGVESVVSEVEDDNTVIIFNTDHINSQTTIPTKYLIKVDAEAKEAKYHKGEKVCYNGYVYEIEGLVGKNRYALKGLNFDLDEDMIEPYEPYTEPTEQTEAKYTKTKGDTLTFQIAFDLSDIYWDAYAADLAKEIVLKTVNSASDKRPSVIAEYATDVAKAVVEGLKRK